VQLVDVMPTVLELLRIPEPSEMDGRSLMSLLTGAATEGRAAAVLSECTWQAKRAVRTRRWKYIRCVHPGVYPWIGQELYNLAVDPSEQNNLALRRPDVVRQLDGYLESWVHRQLDGRADPMLEVLASGLPAIDRLQSVRREDAEVAAAMGPPMEVEEVPALA
jgi:arylsulfatase A-like enzyme